MVNINIILIFRIKYNHLNQQLLFIQDIVFDVLCTHYYHLSVSIQITLYFLKHLNVDICVKNIEYTDVRI
jgi:hypothetical protein